MKRMILTGLLALGAGVAALMAQQAAAPAAPAAKGPAPKSKGEMEALQALFTAQQVQNWDGVIKGADDLLTKYTDTDYKEIATCLEAAAYQQKDKIVPRLCHDNFGHVIPCPGSSSSSGSSSTDSSSALDTEEKVFAYQSHRPKIDRVKWVLDVMYGRDTVLGNFTYRIDRPDLAGWPNWDLKEMTKAMCNPSAYASSKHYQLFRDVVLRETRMPEKQDYSVPEREYLAGAMIPSFRPADIFTYKTVAMTGCNSSARAFQDLAAKIGLDTRYVVTVDASNYDNACSPIAGSPRKYRKGGAWGHMSGHQMVAVKVEGLWKIVNTGNGGGMFWAQRPVSEGSDTLEDIAVTDLNSLLSRPDFRSVIVFADSGQTAEETNLITAILTRSLERDSNQMNDLYTSGQIGDNRCVWPVKPRVQPAPPAPPHPWQGCKTYCDRSCDNSGHCTESCTTKTDDKFDCAEKCDGSLCRIYKCVLGACLWQEFMDPCTNSWVSP
jgi:hypothetical protein